MAVDGAANATGRVLQVNMSGGGIPKRPVDRAWVDRFGLKGDEHEERTVHGGPHQAVCLYGIEAIERLKSIDESFLNCIHGVLAVAEDGNGMTDGLALVAFDNMAECLIVSAPAFFNRGLIIHN